MGFFPYLMEGNEEGDRLFLAVASGSARANGHKLKCMKLHLQREGGQTVDQIAQRGSAVSIPADTQNATALGPQQPAEVDPAGAVGLD